MITPSRAPSRGRLASLSLAALLGAAIAAPGGALATVTPVDAATVSAAETAMVARLNADRTAVGLVAVQVDPRLMAIARARSADMVAKGYFSHTQPDGRNVFAILTASHVTWYNAGEIIAWNNYPMDVTVSTANRQWMTSPGHHAIVVSKAYNYVGVGLALDPVTGKKVWTAVYLTGPDRTAARVRVSSPRVVAGPTTGTRYTRLSWTGYDPRLQVRTAGLRSYAIQRRVDGGRWVTLVSSTTSRSRTIKVSLGHRYEFRIAARDRAGNRGPWVTKVVNLR
jgi:uncharacterized protein YkwD